MKKYKKLPAEQLVDVECDICHKSCKDIEGMNNEYAELHVPGGWGFHSRKDMEHHECDMCESCYDKIRAYIESLGGQIRVESSFWQTPNG